MSIVLDQEAARRFRNRPHARDGAIPPSWRSSRPPTSTTTNSSTSGISSQSQPSSILTWFSQRSTFWTKAGSDTTGQIGGSDPDKPPTSRCWRESYLCVDKCWTSITETNLSTLFTVESMRDDFVLFSEARIVLSGAQGNWLQRFLSWRSYTHVSLSKVSKSSCSFLTRKGLTIR